MWGRGWGIMASLPVPTALASAVGKAFGGHLSPSGLGFGLCTVDLPCPKELGLMGLWARPGPRSLSFTQCPLCAQQGLRRLGKDLVGFAGTWKILSLCSALSI